MNKVIRIAAVAGFIALGVFTGGITFLPGTALAFSVGASTFLTIGLAIGASLLTGSIGGEQLDRAAAASQLQLGENPRGAIVGRMGLAGTLVDAFNYGGDDGTDWEVLVIALADHECDALEGFYVQDSFVSFAGDGRVAGYNNQLEVYWRPGTWNQSVPQILIDHGPGWTANDRGRGVSYVVAAYKADEPEAENPIWTAGRPRFKWVLRGLKCYSARLDTSVGGSGSHRIDDPSTWEWTENLIDIRYNWARGIYAGNRTDDPEMLLVGRGLSAVEAPPQNVFARANLCDEVVGGEARYRVGGIILANETFREVESAFAAACAGTIVQRDGSVEIDPGEPQPIAASFTDGDLITGTSVTWSEFLGIDSSDWVNTVAARFVDPDQQYTQRSAPVRRVTVDVIADGGPREQSPTLGLVTSMKQAQRVAEIFRRLGRLWGRARVTLPPDFTFLEEGDWVQWTSARRFGGATKTFRIDAWSSAANWHHKLTLREINSGVYLDTTPGADNATATQPNAPAAGAAPGALDFTAIGGQINGANGAIPAVTIFGSVSRSNVDRVRFEIREVGEATWEQVRELGRAVTRTTVTGLGDQVDYETAVSYQTAGVWSPRRVLGAVRTGAVTSSQNDQIQADLLSAAKSAGVGDNLILDPGFNRENGYWDDFEPGITFSAGGGRYGSPAVRFDSDGQFRAMRGRDFIPVKADDEFLVELEYRASGYTDLVIASLSQFDGNGDFLGSAFIDASIVSDNTWRILRGKIVLNENAASVKPRLYSGQPNPLGSFCLIDWVAFSRIADLSSDKFKGVLPESKAAEELKNSNKNWGNLGGKPSAEAFDRSHALATMNTGGIGDIRFLANTTHAGSANDGEIKIRGATFFPPNGERFTLDLGRTEIPTPFEGGWIQPGFFVIYSEEIIATRFSGFTTTSFAALNFFVARYRTLEGDWAAIDNSGNYYNFTPRDTDCIVASGTKPTAGGGIASISSLVSVSRTLPTVQRGATAENLFFDNFDSYVDAEDLLQSWESVAGSGELSFGTSSVLPGASTLTIGNNSGNDERWLIARDRIPNDEDALFEIEWVVRQFTGPGRVFLGVCGFAEDKTTYVRANGGNAFTGQHYVAASNLDMPGGVQKIRGYFKGRAGSGNGGQHNKPSDPATLHTNVDYFSPMAIGNYEGEAGQFQIASCRVRKVSIETIDPATGRANDARIAPPFLSLNLGAKFSSVPTFSASGGSATISLPAGSVQFGNDPISYNGSSATVSGSGVVTHHLYYDEDDDPATWGGSKVLQATTDSTVLRASNNRVYAGSISVNFQSGSSGSGGGGGGSFDDGAPPGTDRP